MRRIGNFGRDGGPSTREVSQALAYPSFDNRRFAPCDPNRTAEEARLDSRRRHDYPTTRDGSVFHFRRFQCGSEDTSKGWQAGGTDSGNGRRGSIGAELLSVSLWLTCKV